MSLVDVWAQVPTERMAHAHWMAPLLRWTGRPGELLLPGIDETLAAMDAADIGLSLLSAWYGPEGTLVSNDELHSQLDAAPGRFRGLLGADVRNPMEAVRELRDRLQDDSFVGVRIIPWLWQLPPDDRRFYPVYAACVDAGVPLCTQIGHTGPLMPSEFGRPIPALERVLLDFPELVVVGGHVGFPWLDEVVTLTIKFPNFYVDTSAYALHRLPEAFVAYMKGVGRERVMFGTNWPMLTPEQCLGGLDALELPTDTRRNFLGDTARRVFGLPGTQ